MMNRRGFAIASYLILLGWVLAVIVAVVAAGAGVASAAGWSDDYRHRIELIPGTDLLTVETAPTWNVVGGGAICDPVRVTDYPSDCYGLLVQHGEQRLDGDVVLPADIRAVEAHLSGHVVLDAASGWQPLLVAIWVMQVASILVIAFVLYQLWRMLRSAAGGEPFAPELVRRLRWMGGVLLGWEILEPVAWLFLSPKALDYSAAYYGPVPPLQFGSMEPGGPDLAVMAFGVLMLLLASVFRHGAGLAEEQRLTV